MIIPIVLVLAVGLLMPKPPDITDPQLAAQWAECDAGKISWFIGQKIDYKLMPKWESATSCLERGTGDCKCYATTAKEIMDNCNGWRTRLITVRRWDGERFRYHAVTYFVDHKGNKGYINGQNFKMFDGDKDLEELLENIEGGPWEYVHG